MANSYHLPGGDEGDGVGLQGEHSQTFKLMTNLLVLNHLKM